jgi:hypothetical protein
VGALDKSEWEFLFLYVLGWGTIIAALPFGFYIRKQFASASPVKRRNILVCLAVALLTGFAVVKSAWSFTGITADAAMLSLTFLAYFGLIFLLSLLPPRNWSWILTLICTLPLAVAVLPLSFGMIFIVGDEVPRFEGKLTRNYSYQINWYGNATTTHDGADVKILFHPWPLSFLEKEVFVKRFSDTDCSFDKLEVRAVPDSNHVLIDCPGAPQTVFPIK